MDKKDLDFLVEQGEKARNILANLRDTDREMPRSLEDLYIENGFSQNSWTKTRIATKIALRGELSSLLVSKEILK